MKNFIWALVIVIILGGGYLLWQNSAQNVAGTPTPASSPTSPSPEPTPAPAPSPTPTGAPITAAVTYSASGFSPAEVTIKKGGTVTWRNTSGGQMWVASAQHPSHMVYSGTSREQHCPDTSGTAFDQCAGETGNYSFTFQKVGTWNYHDHLSAQKFGKVIVVE